MNQSRCEECFTLLPTTELCGDGADQVCVVCLDKREKSRLTPFYQHATAHRTAVTHGRCEKCLNLFALVTMKLTNGAHLCETCVKGGKEWYALALTASEAKVTKDLRRSAEKLKVKHLIGKISSPKVQEARVTKPSWEAIDEEGVVLGTVSGDCAEEALRQAKLKFEPRTQKGAFKPSRADMIQPPLAKIVKTTEKTKVDGKWAKRVVYVALSEDETVLGKIGGAKSPKHAEEIAVRMYGAKDRPNVTPFVQAYVKEVRQVKDGGEIRINNRRAMKGYLIVEVVPTNDVMSVLKTCPGVYSVLPYADRPSVKKAEEGDFTKPAGLSIKEIEKHVKTPKQVLPALPAYKVGQQVKIVDGPYSGQETQIREALEKDTYAVTVKILGTPTVARVHAAEIRANN